MVPKLAFAMAADKTRHVFDDEALARLSRTCDIVRATPLEEFFSAEARRVLGEIDILVTGWGCPMVTAEVVRAAPNLKLIAHAAGTVKFTLDPAVYEAGIRVTHAADANAVPVAEYTLAAILFANKRVFELRDRYRADPGRRSTYALMDEPIGNYHRTVGLVGASRIGRRVAKMLAGFDFTVLLSDPFVTRGDPVLAGAELVDLDTLMARSDVVSVHAPSLPETRAMIGARQFKLMKHGAGFINTARGAVVDEAAMIAELQTGRIHAVIDVTDPEIPEAGSPLYSLPNVFLTPHLAGAVGTERLRLGQLAIEEVERFVAGKAMEFEIEPALLERLA
ncbi:2-hydroxyacid dehydrogenase [Devosia psychrophila]|uniref:2-hydroxyacid dehydrogenase n=2 Tax=Devosia psychrophila TaxID=728005 RepID=A0A0F5PS35_9HYPH|nr:hydroxyacid dehydrogenase [Devosia psychrophila]KKC31415.1 2-hydroxyacid dehydrogenase [Devosia psychrophila]SFC94082.1 Phosphoglycerate dehydrogenase [Devosia psychrophila]